MSLEEEIESLKRIANFHGGPKKDTFTSSGSTRIFMAGKMAYNTLFRPHGTWAYLTRDEAISSILRFEKKLRKIYVYSLEVEDNEDVSIRPRHDEALLLKNLILPLTEEVLISAD